MSISQLSISYLQEASAASQETQQSPCRSKTDRCLGEAAGRSNGSRHQSASPHGRHLQGHSGGHWQRCRTHSLGSLWGCWNPRAHSSHVPRQTYPEYTGLVPFRAASVLQGLKLLKSEAEHPCYLFFFAGLKGMDISNSLRFVSVSFPLCLAS